MNRFLYGFLAFLFLFLSIYPFSNVFADNDLIITGTPVPVQGDITDDQLKDIIVAGITADLVSQGYSIDLSASDGDWDNFKNAILDYIFNSAASGSGFWGEIYNSALYHNLIDENFTLWYPDTSDGSILPGISKRSIYRNLSENLINNFLDSRPDSPTSTPSPSPDSNYIQYIDCINGDTAWGNSQAYIPLMYNFEPHPDMQYSQFLGSIRGRTIYRNPNTGGGFVKPSGYTSYTYAAGIVTGSNIVTIRIYEDSQGFYITDFQKPLEKLFYYTYNNPRETAFGIIVYPEGYYSSTTNMNYDYYNYYENQFQAHYNSLDDLFQFLVQTVRNVNIYVNDVPWSLVTENEQLPTITINPGYVLQGTDYPLVYNFPEPPYFDYQRMIDIIKHALLQYGVIQWEDIADVFVDVNGQTAVAILEIHRNDYDILYDEQYHGIALPNRFNTHLLDTSHQYLSPVVQTVEETTGVLPGEIKGALAIGMMLTIFACLIHRLLE